MPVSFAQIVVKPLLNLEGQTSEPSLAPDGSTLIFDWCKPDYSCGVYTRPIGGGNVTVFAGRDARGGMPFSPRWSPDGRRVAFIRMYSHFDNHLFVRDVGSGAERDLGQVCDVDYGFSWSLDGRFLVASFYSKGSPETYPCRLVLLSTESGAVVRQLAQNGQYPALSPDGRTLAYASGRTLMLLTVSSVYVPSRPPSVLAREPREISGVFWTPDGKQLLYQVSGDVEYLRRIATTPGARPQAFPSLSADLSITQLRADGSAYATETTQTEALWRANLASGQKKPEIVRNPHCLAGSPVCSPDVRTIVYISARTGLAEIWLSDADGKHERPLLKKIPGFVDPDDAGAPDLVGWSPDGKWIAFTVFPRRGNADVRSDLYVVSPSTKVLRRLGSQAYSLALPAWSRDSKSLYAAQGFPIDDSPHLPKSPIVRVNIEDGSILPIGAEGIWPKPSPDGRFIYLFSFPHRRLLRISTAGGTPEEVSNNPSLLWFSFDVGAKYVYLFELPPRNVKSRTHTLIRLDPESHQELTLGEVPFEPRSAFLSPDERFLYFAESEDPKERAVVVKGLF